MFDNDLNENYRLIPKYHKICTKSNAITNKHLRKELFTVHKWYICN